MARLFIYIVIEAILLISGISIGFDVVLTSDLTKSNWLIIGGGAVAGLSLGLFFGWLALQVFSRPPRMSWLACFTFLSAWIIGGLVFYLRAGQPGSDWRFVAMAVAFGTLPGLLVGMLLTWYAPASGVRRRAQPTKKEAAASENTALSIAVEDLADYGPPPATYAPPPPAVNNVPGGPVSDPQLKRAMQTLMKELEHLEEVYPSSASQLLEPDEQHAVVVFNMPSYLGPLSFYIVCNSKYPRTAPEEVHIELVENGGATEFPYDSRLLDGWDKNYGLEAIVKDGMLQVEEARISG